MRLVKIGEAPTQQVEEGAKGMTVRWLIARPEGAPNFAMRLFEISPGGNTPQHEHEWEHVVYVLDGDVDVITKEGASKAGAGDAVLVMPGERHQFRNVGGDAVKFLCMIPLPKE